MRKITVHNKTYRWKAGSLNVVIRDDNNKWLVDFSEITGRSWDVIERGQRKKTLDGIVMPIHIATYIQNKIA